MKNVISYKVSFLLAGLMLFSISCEREILNTSPKGVLAEGVLSAETVDKLVIAAYHGLAAHFFGNDESFAGPANNWIIDVMSDDAYKGGGGVADRTDLAQLETFTHDPTNYAVFQKWRNPYFAIARCNLAIREIQNLNDPTYDKNVRIGEMKLLRGHFHFDLIRNFGNIAYLDENADPTATTNTALSQEEILARIEQDFMDAYNTLPAVQQEVGRVNKYIAAAYLAKLYVEMEEWEQVLTYTAFVKNGDFELLTEFEDLSTLEFENGPEAVFAIQYSSANIFANHDWSSLLNSTLSPGIDAGGYAGGDDFYHGSQNLVNAFRTDADGLPLFDSFDDEDVRTGAYQGSLDPRVDFTFGRLGIPWKGTAVYSESWIRSPDYYPGFSSKKSVVAPDDPSVHNSWPWAASGLNASVIRYAEVLLWEAEARIESNNDLEAARQLINQVRERAMNSTPVKTLDGSADAANYNIGLYPAAGWNQELARKAVRFERRLELAMEGHRFYDLRRWGILSQTMNAYFQTESELMEYLNGITFTENKHEFLPIPQGEIDLAPDLYSQNPGY